MPWPAPQDCELAALDVHRYKVNGGVGSVMIGQETRGCDGVDLHEAPPRVRRVSTCALYAGVVAAQSSLALLAWTICAEFNGSLTLRHGQVQDATVTKTRGRYYFAPLY